MTNPSLWKRTSAVREVSGLELRVVVDPVGRWRFTVSRQGMKPDVKGIRATEVAAMQAAVFAARKLTQATGEQQ